MKHFIAPKTGRTFIIRLEPGDFLREALVDLAKTEEIENAVVVSGIATFDQANFQMATTLDYPVAYHVEHLEEPLELASLDGTIIHAEPHIHGVISNATSTWAGHLLDGCRILYLAEIVIQELTGNDLIRKKNDKGVFLIDER